MFHSISIDILAWSIQKQTFDCGSKQRKTRHSSMLKNHWSWGGSGPGGGVVPGGGGLVPGGWWGSGPGRGVSGPGGVWSQGGVWSRGGGWCVVPGRLVSQHALRQKPPPVNRMTNMCKNITLDTTSLRPVKTQIPCYILCHGHPWRIKDVENWRTPMRLLTSK